MNMEKIFKYALMAMMVMGIAMVLNACSKSSDDPDPEAEENHIEDVVPQDIVENIDDYMPIYDGSNPPNIEGTYLMSPAVSVYASDATWGAGKKFADIYLKFSNQNSKTNTLDYKDRQSGDGQSAKGAYISGSGNNFTLFFKAAGTSIEGISMKNAMVISGTKTSKGISNLHYAFVLVEKEGDPDDTKMMKVGGFRVFKDQDGLSEPDEWPSSTRIAELTDGNNDLPESFFADK